MNQNPNQNPNQPPEMLPDDEIEPQVMSVKIINRNDFVIRDMFDGVPYEFEPNRPKAIPIDAANHIFGWFPKWTDAEGKEHEPDPVEMKRHIQRRFGWNTPDMVKTGQNNLFYGGLEIIPIMYRMVPVEVPQDQPAPVMSERTAQEIARTRAPKRNALMEAAAEAAARA